MLTKNGQLDRVFIRKLTSQIAYLRQHHIECLLVSSGAIGCGLQMLGRKKRFQSLPDNQAAAAIGQSRLMNVYDDIFRKQGLVSAQILITQEDLRDRLRYLNATHTLLSLLKHKAVPIINENDTVSVEEIKFGDNDTLAALVSILVKADLLVLLTSVDGLMDMNLQQRLSEVKVVNATIESMAQGTKDVFASGGMVTKIEAAKIVTRAGEPMVIANGRKANVIHEIINGQDVGTFFHPRKTGLNQKKRWIAFAGRCHGTIVIDQGAQAALVERGKSLLASGVTALKGSFKVGDLVEIADGHKVLGRGLVNYSALDLDQIKGLKAKQIKPVLGHCSYDEIIHRDNLAFNLKKEQERLMYPQIIEQAQKAKRISLEMVKLTTDQKNQALLAMAEDLLQAKLELQEANQKDLKAGQDQGLSGALLDRLTLNDDRIKAMSDGLRQIAALKDPVGVLLEEVSRPNGLKINKVRVPIGVIGIIYESRPNVTADVAGLCLKSGNAVILKGGREAIHSNQAIVKVLSQSLKRCGLSEDIVQFINEVDRNAVEVMLKQNQSIDLIIPRGGTGLIRAVAQHSTIPVLKHLDGICHVYVDTQADLTMAEKIVINAKCQRLGFAMRWRHYWFIDILLKIF